MKFRSVKHASGKVEIIKATFYTILAVLLAFPIASLSDTVRGDYQGIYMNGQLIGFCETEAEARNAYLQARQHKNDTVQGLALYDVDVTFGPVRASSRELQTTSELADTIYEKLDNYQSAQHKQLAYTMKIKNYTVTLASKEDVTSLLDQIQAAYDTENRFQVVLTPDEERESNAMTVVVEDQGNTDLVMANVVSDTVATAPADTAAATDTAAPADTAAATDTAVPADTAAPTDTTAPADTAAPTDTTAATDTVAPADTAAPAEGQEMTAEQYAATDGIVGMGFDRDILVSETYVTADKITDTATALADITQQNVEKGVYEVKVGDCLSTIAEDHGMSTSDLLSMNPDLQVDSNILVGDEIVVTVPETPLSVVVSEQKTYTEEYDAPVQYVDDDTAYQGTNTVVQEAVKGERVVTAVIEYTNGTETNRDIIHEEIKKAAVAKVVKRGTKSRPTYIRPISGGRQTSGYGQRWGRLHKGVDWACSVGTTVHAARGGKVVSAGWNGSYGYSVLIDHGDGIKTRYAHMSKLSVKAGQYVDQGDTLGKSGNTGRSTGPHLHFEVIVNGSPVNPLKYV